MKKTIMLLTIALSSFNVFADEHYKCYSIRKGSPLQDVTMKIATGLLTKRITSVELVSKIKGRNFEAVPNPFTSVDASYYPLDEEAVREASPLNFKIVRKIDGRSSSSIALSESLLKFGKSGFAHYEDRSCFWILDCHTSVNYFKCDKI